jgi:uncharacterized membrane protein
VAFARKALCAALVACGGPADAEGPCSPYVTWATVGEPYVRTWCASCHAADLHGPDRAGAPLGVDFDTLDDVRSRADRVSQRVTDDTMPPSTAPDATERTRFLDWMRCGLPE